MRALLTMLAVAAVAAGCGGSDAVPTVPAEGEAPAEAVVELDGLEQLEQRFEAGRGAPRLLLVFSPT